MKILDYEELVALAQIDIDNNALSDALIKLKYANQVSEDDQSLPMLARVYARIGLFEKAKLFFRKYLDNNPGALIEKFQYGMVHFDSKDDDGALMIFQEILQTEKQHPPALYYTAAIYSRNHNTDKAIQKLEQLLSTVPKENLFYLRAGELLTELKNQPGQNSQTSTENLNEVASGLDNDVLLN